MNQEKKSIFQKLNPRNFKLESKIHLLIFTVVLFTIIYMAFAGLSLARNLLVETTTEYLDELAVTKQIDIEMKVEDLTDRISGFVTTEKYRFIANELIDGFKEVSPGMSSTPGLNDMEEQLYAFYKEYLEPRAPISDSKLINLFPVTESAITAQYLYILQNPKRIGNKSEYGGVDDFHSYNSAHRNDHHLLRSFMEQVGAKDLMIINPESGDVVYSVAKNIDFGANLFDGPLKNTALSVSFRKALAGREGEVFFEDLTIYPPDFDRPTLFFSAPIIYFNELQAVVVLHFGADYLDNLIYTDLELIKSGSLEYDLIGNDLKLRNNPKGYILDSEEYVKYALRKVGKVKRDEVIEHHHTGTMALAASFPSSMRQRIESGEFSSLVDYTGKNVLATVRRVELPGSDLNLIVKVDKGEALLDFFAKSKIYSLSIILVLVLVFFLGRVFGRALTSRLKQLLESMALLRKGEKAKVINPGAPDELGATIDTYNLLRDRMVKAEEFAIEMSEGNYNFEFETYSESDSLGTSLNILKERLKKTRDENEQRKQEDETRNWINTGIARFNDLLRQNNDDINTLAYSVIENLVEYLDANQGGIFLVEGENEAEKKIELVASFAYDRRKYQNKSIEIGEGILGSIYLEKKPVYLKDIPEDYIEITSGLGQSTPRSLYVFPLMVDENVLGMIEIASFNEILPHQIEFLEKLAESVAATFISVRLNMRTVLLLDESNRKAEEIAQQEEEMRQNMEEMQATQEELARLRQDDEKRTKEMQLLVDNTRSLLKNLLDAIPGGYILKDANGVIHLANAEGAEYYHKSPDAILGKTDHELLAAAMYKKEHKNDEEVLEEGEKAYTEEVTLKGEKVKFNVLKKQFHIEEIQQLGVLTIRQRI